MADYRLNSGDESQGVFDRINNRNISEGNIYWQEYLDWKALGNTPDPLYTLEEAKVICVSKAINDYESDMTMPILNGADEIDLSEKSRAKITNAKASSKATKKARKTNGRAVGMTESELDYLIDLIDDRDDTYLDALDTTLDAIEAATTIEELAPYMPEIGV